MPTFRLFAVAVVTLLLAAVAPAAAQAQSISVTSAVTTSFADTTPVTITLSEVPQANSVQLLLACASGPCTTAAAQSITLFLGKSQTTYSLTLVGSNLTTSTSGGSAIVNVMSSSPSSITYLPDGTWNLTARYTRTSTGAVVNTASAFQQTYWRTTPTPVITAPASGTATSRPINIAFTLPADPQGNHTVGIGSLKLTFAGSGTPFVLQLADGTIDSSTGQASLALDPSAPLANTNVLSVTGGPAIPDDTYAITVSYQDSRGHAAATATVTGVVLRTATPPPVLIAPTTGSTITFPPAVIYSLPVAASLATLTFSPAGGGTATMFALPPSSLTGTFVVPRSATGLIGSFTVAVAYSDALGNPLAAAQATNVTIQSDCASGSYLSGICQPCTVCAAGQYQTAACTATTDATCASCGAVPNCTTVTCSSSTDQQCVACAPGYFMQGGACVTCSTTCPAGQYEMTSCSATADHVCGACVPIDHCASETCAPGGAGTCSACASGYYLSGNACVACSASCGTGQYQSAACGAAADRTCAACATVPNCATPTCSGPSDQRCAQCATGFYLDNGACVACSATCPAGQLLMAACSATADRTCAACDASCATCSGSPAHCTSCATGGFLDQGACQACRVCGLGSYQVTACGAAANTVCADCSAGTASAVTNASACQRCAAGSFSANAGAVNCTSCAAGTYSTAGQNACSACASGDVAPSAMATTCMACAAGQFPSADNTACLSCPAGTASNADDTACTACAPGSFAANDGATACVPCAVGTFATSPGATSCEACPTGTYADMTGSVRCHTCVAGDPAGGTACAMTGVGGAGGMDSAGGTSGIAGTSGTAGMGGAATGSSAGTGVGGGTAGGGMAGTAGGHGGSVTAGGTKGSGGGVAGSGAAPSTTGDGCSCALTTGATDGGLTVAVALLAMVLARARRARKAGHR